ncbi:protein-glutamate O-methyltransferase CheR [bacterium]|nr:protein-glutamate O-methyltransferase CheR [bacterium]
MIDENDFEVYIQNIFDILNAYYSIDFSSYKLNCLQRRIKRRMIISKIDKVEEYLELISNDEKERSKLMDTITINVTRFFRDEKTYNYIYKNLLPKFTQKKDIKVWSAGCSSGEEPYSIAMLLDYYKTEKHLNYNYNIFATDIDSRSIDKGLSGVYTPKSIYNLSDIFHIIFNFYIKKQGNYYYIDENIMNSVHFEKNSIFSSNWEGKFDFIFCRNVFIYFSRELQNQALQIFRDHLKDDGYLVLGRVETIFFEKRNIFNIISNRDKIYSKKIKE